MEGLAHFTALTNLPLSSSQIRLWLVAQQDLSNPSYNLHLTYHFRGEIDYDVLCSSVNLLFEKHYAIFSTFKQKNGEPYIEIVKRNAELEFIDFSGIASSDVREKVNSFLGDDLRKSFDLEKGPLFRLFLIKENNNSFFFHATIHHLIFDGYSRKLFVNELGKIYTGLLSGRPAATEQPGLQSFDYAEAGQTLLEEQERALTTEFWKNTLKDCPVETRLPYDFQRKSVPSGFGYRESFEIGRELTSGLKKIADESGTSLFTATNSLLGILFQKYSCGNDICIGIPVSNRRHFPQSEKTFGLFLNTCVVRLAIDSRKSFRDHVRQAKAGIKDTLNNSKLPFASVVEAVNPERVPGVNPLFQISLSWLNGFTVPMQFGELTGRKISLPNCVSPFDITFYMWEEDGSLRGDIEYNQDVFNNDTILRLKENLVCLVKGIVENPNQKLSEISFISTDEQHKLAGFNRTKVPVSDCLLHAFFEKQAEIHPDKTAVISGGSTLTYRELNERSNQLSNHLLNHGALSGDVIGISLDRSVDMIVSVLAVLKAGCCYLSMDPAFPIERLSYMFDDAAAKTLITQSSYRDRFTDSINTSVVYIDSDNEAIGCNRKSQTTLQIDNNAAAYIIYTSGSTGKPKGVTVPHKSVVNLVESMTARPGIKESDKTLAVVTLSFDMSVYEIFVTLSNGATLVVADSHEVTEGTALINLIEKYNITLIQATPSLWSILLSAGWKGKKNLKGLCGGEALTYSLIHEVLSKVGEFWNCYGPTETTVYSTCMQVVDENAQIVIGKPINNTSIYIIDADNLPVPIGVAGEVCIGGNGLALGYHNRPDLTQEKFITLQSGEVVYRTGDQGRFLNDGNIELFGRLDNQIKLRGFRIEPGEIETLLSKLNGVIEAVVKPHKFSDSDERLVAFLNAGDSFKMPDEEISSYLAQNLPAYMIPSFYKVLNGFPRLPNGKINKKELVFNVIESDIGDQFDFELISETQKRLITLWQNIVKIKPKSLKISFFDAGGNSLLGIKFLNSINELFGVTVTFRELITNPSLNKLSAIIESKTVGPESDVTLVHNTSLTNLPLTSNQKRIWFISKMEPDVASYIISNTHKISGKLNIDVFQQSLEKLFERHFLFYSKIKNKDGEPYIEIIPGKTELPYFDFSNFTEEEKSKRMAEMLETDTKKAFDLEMGPLYRMYLIHTEADVYYFHISIHHIIFDGWSWSVFANDLSKIYDSLLTQQLISLPDLEFQEYDYAQWEKSYSGSVKEIQSIKFWEDNLKGCSSVINFPYDFPRKDGATGRGGLEKIRLSKELSGHLKQISKEAGVPLFTTMLSALGILLNKYSGEDDINIGMPVAYRPYSKLEKIIGMFVNTVVVRLKYEKGLTIRDAIQRSGIAALNAISHQDLLFENLVELVRPERLANTNPLFQVAFAWQSNLKTSLNLSGIKSEIISGGQRSATFDITVALWENEDCIEGEIEFNEDILQHETIARFQNHFRVILECLVSQIDKPVTKISLISPVEMEMIEKVNDTVTDYPGNKTIIEIFQRIAAKHPDKVALSFKGQSITYKELNERANQLGRSLREQGVKANVPVGIFADKSFEMIIGIIAVLKAGGCYTPIDPEYPQQRINFIIKDAGIKIILLQHKYLNFPFNEVIKTDLDPEYYYNQNRSDIELVNTPDDNAYILYTSGTTGTPKGTPIHHRGVIRLVINNNFITLNEEDRVLLSGAIVFDATVLELWGTLLNGGSLFIIDRETLLSEVAMEKEMAENEITSFFITSALFTHFVENRIAIFKTLKNVVVGGDVLSTTHANKLRAYNPAIKLINAYGPTENSCTSTFYNVDHDFSSRIPIGRPNGNSTVYIFDKNMNYLPVGIPGELYVGGDGLSKGYLNRPDLNVKCFIEHPHKQGERIYKTGDLVRWLPDWNIDFLGRVDNQIKIRGYRVEIEEIESVLSEIDGVIEAVVKPVKVEEGDYRLVAFLNISNDFNKDTTAVVAHLKSRLPAYMMPSSFKLMETFPKTINGKTDRKALNAEYNEPEKDEHLDAETLPLIQKRVYDLWCKILKTRISSVIDSFFDVGGNSLLGLRLLNRLREEFGVKISFNELVVNSSISQLAEMVETRSSASDNLIELTHLTDTSNLPLTNNQKRLWLITQMQPSEPSYIIPNTHKLSGSLNPEIFSKSLEKLFERHFVVFSKIKSKDGEPYIEITPGTAELPYFDLRHLTETEKSERVAEMLVADTKQAFDLEKGPLYRMFLIQTEDDVYYFHISIHHIIFDGWSWSVFAGDLQEIYSSLLHGKEINLPPLEFQEYDLASWEKSLEGTAIEKKLIEFWTANLEGCSPVLNFPYDYQRKEQPSNRGSQVSIKLTKQLTGKIKKLAKKEGTSLFTTLLTAFGIELHKYSGEYDVNIGLWVANRPHTKLENIFGLFVNTIVARLHYDKDLTFRDTLHLTNDTALNAISHQDLSFDKVVDIVNPERTSNVNPLFQVVFAWQDNLGMSINLESVNDEQVIENERSITFDITLSLWESDEAIQGIIEYNVDILKHSSITRLKNNYVHLLELLADNPQQKIDGFSIASESDKIQLDGFNNTEVDVPQCLIYDLFEEQALLYPDNTAVTQGNTKLSYKTLSERSNQLARYLISLGVRNGDTVGISLERTTDMVVTVLGVLKSGCAYLPMDPSFPDDRLAFMFEDSGAKVLITESSLIDKYKHLRTKVVFTDSDKENICNSDITPPELNISSQSIAYVIYTSGSTGKPKGVKVHHQAVVNFLKSMSDTPGITGNDRLLAVTTLSFDISVLEIFLPLTNGAELVVAGYDEVMDGHRLVDLLNEHDITILQATPATWNLILADRWTGKKNLKALCGGEAIPSSLIKELLPKVSSLWNMYGPTETTVWSTCFNITDSEAQILVGKPIYNTKIFIVDNSNNLLPIGAIGEVVIGGMGVTKGYHNRPELTEEKFFRFNEEGIVYKTGDKGRFLDNGNIELLGRIDSQIKLRGFRIEPGEIETLLAGIPEVREAVVKVHKFEDGDEHLIAFLNATPEYKKTNEEITDMLSVSLPSYMIPSLYQISDGFPRLPNGKINKKALVFESNLNEAYHKGYTGELSETEETLMEIWRKILKTVTINPSQNFFSIGGNSLLAISLMNKIKEQTNTVLAFRDILTHPTISLLADLIDKSVSKTERSVNLVHTTDTSHLPLTNNQKRLWLISKLNPEVPLYNIRMPYRFKGSFDPEIFETSLEILFNRHYVMFSQIREENFEPYCEIVPRKVNVRYFDFSGSQESNKSQKIMDTLDEDSKTPYDLSEGPLYRLSLIKASEEDFYFQICVHHIIFDGWSQGVLVNDLNQIYNSLVKGKEIKLPEIEIQQFDFARWENSLDYVNERSDSVTFWKENLNGCSSLLNFPFDFQRGEKQSWKAGSVKISISKTLSDRLRHLSEEEHSSLFAAMLSVFGLQLSKYSGEDDLNIGLPVAYRPHSKLENILGMFVNTVVVRFVFEKEQTIRSIIRKTNEAAINAIAHQDLPFEHVVEVVNPERSSVSNPIFQVGFAWQNNLVKPFDLAGVRTEEVKVRQQSPIFDITLYMWEKGGHLEGEFEFNTDLLKEETVFRLKENFIHLLEVITSNPDQTFSSIVLATEKDRNELSRLKGMENPVTNCLIQKFFEDQAVSRPDKDAVISGAGALTYKELEERSNQVANHLIALGVKGGDVVGICLERSAEMIVSVLGVLKAGCCYLPMDPSFPDDRIKYMFEDSGARVLISQKSLKSKFLNFSDALVILTDTDNETIARQSAEKPALHINNMSPAYIIYTSGSTGKPKGVIVHHKSVVNLIESMSVIPGISKDDKVLAVVTLSFDMSVFEIFVSLSKGATIVVAGSRDVTDGAALMKIIEKQDITVIQATPSFWNILLSSGWKGKKDMKALCGGEALTYSLIRQMLPKVAEFWNCYGPTETTVYSTCMQVTDENAPILIGKPINNTIIHILDKYNNLLPPGVTGEVGIGGAGVTNGYHNKPDLTMEKFIRFEDGNIVYKTGDQGKMLDDGSIELFGRLDNQIKLRGFRIEPGEIETLLTSFPHISEAVVKLHSFGKNDERLVAFILVDEKFDLTKEDIVTSLSAHLPQYMVPSFFQSYTDFPRLPNGKINKKALVFSEDSIEKEQGNNEERTPTEESVYQIWKEELKIENISVKDNFFFLGGNSLLAISVVSKIESVFKMDLGLRMFFDRPCIENIAEHIDMRKLRSAQTPNVKSDDDTKSRLIEGEI